MTPTSLKNNPSSSLLKDTRLSKGLTLDIVHEATKVPMDALKAIEEGYSTRILTPFYYRGFVKIYAEFLGLNVNDVLKEYNVQSPAMKPTLSPTVQSVFKPKAPVRPPVTKSKTPSLATDGTREFWNNLWTPRNLKILLRVLAVVVALVVLVKITGCVAKAVKAKPKIMKVAPPSPVKQTKKHVTKVETPKPKPQPPPEVVEQKETPAVVVQEEPQKVAAQSVNHKVTLTVHASNNTWIQVKTDGKVAFEMTMKKGTVESWEAKKDIEISGKNIGDLDLEVNGKDVSPLGTFGRHVRKVLITKDGLTVQK